MSVPLLDLQLQFKSIENEIREVIDGVLSSQRFIMGPEVEACENEIAAYCDVDHAIGVSSGTDALLVALMALGVGDGDEVITSPYSFFASAGCIARLGARPVFVDIDPTTFNIDSTKIEGAITPSTKAILPIHLFGQCANMVDILQIADIHNLPVIEDAAQALGAEVQGKRAGSLGKIGCFSFFPSKNLGAFGDAGMVVTNDDQLAEKIRVLRAHGSNPKYYHELVGGNFRLDALQAAIIRVKLKYLENWSQSRQENAKLYDLLLSEVGAINTPIIQKNYRHIYNQYVIRAENRDRVLNYLRGSGIGCEIYYPIPLHLQKCFEYLGYKAGDAPNAELCAADTIAIPIYPELTSAQQHKVVETLLDGLSAVS